MCSKYSSDRGSFIFYFSVRALKNLKQCVIEQNLEDNLLDCSNDCVSACMRHLVATLDRAIGKRVHLLQVHQPDNEEVGNK